MSVSEFWVGKWDCEWMSEFRVGDWVCESVSGRVGERVGLWVNRIVSQFWVGLWVSVRGFWVGKLDCEWMDEFWVGDWVCESVSGGRVGLWVSEPVGLWVRWVSFGWVFEWVGLWVSFGWVSGIAIIRGEFWGGWLCLWVSDWWSDGFVSDFMSGFWVGLWVNEWVVGEWVGCESMSGGRVGLRVSERVGLWVSRIVSELVLSGSVREWICEFFGR